jgi:zinc D-Ala-D-Ala carboxypeptidase
MGPASISHLAEINRQLGIPLDYANRRGLPPHAEVNEAELVLVAVNSEGTAIRLAPPAAKGWVQMHAAATEAGLVLLPLSGFRSIARQTDIIRGKLAAGRSLDEILTVLAAPGYSEHHTGRAIDIGAPDEPPQEEGFALTPAFHWLSEHAAHFGFHLSYPRGNPYGIAYEPWHWCWREEGN